MADDIFTNLPRKADALGTPERRYRNRPALGVLLIALVVGVRLVVAALLVGMGFRAYGPLDGRPSVFGVMLLVVALAAAAACVGSAVRVVVRGGRGGNVRGIIRRPGGLVCVLDDRVVVAPWDEIDWVWDAGLRFRTRGGDEVVMAESLQGFSTLAELVVRQTFDRLTICASAVLLGGGRVEFGPIKMTRDEIAVGDTRLTWADVADVDFSVRRLSLSLYRAGQRLPAVEVPLRDVPNLHTALEMIFRLREGGLGSVMIGPGPPEPPESE